MGRQKKPAKIDKVIRKVLYHKDNRLFFRLAKKTIKEKKVDIKYFRQLSFADYCTVRTELKRGFDVDIPRRNIYNKTASIVKRDIVKDIQENLNGIIIQNQNIYISNDQSAAEQFITICHELSHYLDSHDCDTILENKHSEIEALIREIIIKKGEFNLSQVNTFLKEFNQNFDDDYFDGDGQVQTEKSMFGWINDFLIMIKKYLF